MKKFIRDMVLLGAFIVACCSFTMYAIPRMYLWSHFDEFTSDGCRATFSHTVSHRFPDGEWGWIAHVTVTPERLPCTVRLSLAEGLNEGWYYVGLRGEGVWSSDRPIDAQDMRDWVELDLIKGQLGEEHRLAVVFRRRGK